MTIRFRCVNDFWGYCSNKPVPGRGKVVFLKDGQQLVDLNCKLSPKTCNRYLTHTELCKEEGLRKRPRKHIRG